jgi:hypothetical protein
MVMGITEDLEGNIWVEATGTPGALIRIFTLTPPQKLPMGDYGLQMAV